MGQRRWRAGPVARPAREAFLAGGTPSGTRLLRLSRRGEAAKGTDEMLARARGEIDLLKTKLAKMEARLAERR